MIVIIIIIFSNDNHLMEAVCVEDLTNYFCVCLNYLECQVVSGEDDDDDDDVDDDDDTDDDYGGDDKRRKNVILLYPTVFIIERNRYTGHEWMNERELYRAPVNGDLELEFKSDLQPAGFWVGLLRAFGLKTTMGYLRFGFWVKL